MVQLVRDPTSGRGDSMTQQLNDAAAIARRHQEWRDDVTSLITEIEQWASTQKWVATRGQTTVRDDVLGTGELPSLRVQVRNAQISVTPVGSDLAGQGGRVDLDAFPTLSRVKLIRSAEGWRILTDSNVPLRMPWNQDTFVQLVHDLVS